MLFLFFGWTEDHQPYILKLLRIEILLDLELNPTDYIKEQESIQHPSYFMLSIPHLTWRKTSKPSQPSFKSTPVNLALNQPRGIWLNLAQLKSFGIENKLVRISYSYFLILLKECYLLTLDVKESVNFSFKSTPSLSSKPSSA